YKAVFTSNKEIDLLDEDDQIQETITATDIVINTGANPVIPSIDGVETSQHLYDSTGIMALTTQPKQLVIDGGGYIALEFASMFVYFSTISTILESHDVIKHKEDKEIVS